MPGRKKLTKRIAEWFRSWRLDAMEFTVPASPSAKFKMKRKRSAPRRRRITPQTQFRNALVADSKETRTPAQELADMVSEVALSKAKTSLKRDEYADAGAYGFLFLLASSYRKKPPN